MVLDTSLVKILGGDSHNYATDLRLNHWCCHHLKPYAVFIMKLLDFIGLITWDHMISEVTREF